MADGDRNRVSLVTGASSGIGEATALRLLEAGHVVYAGARRVERMAALADQGIHVRSLDVTDDDSMVALVDAIVAEQGRIDVLVNNAGYGSYGSVEDVPLSEGRYQLEVNLFGLARLTQLVLPHMRSARSGTIVNVSSMGGTFGEPLGAWYHASKFAVEGFSDSLRMEMHEFGVKVVVVEPGAIKTEWGSIALDSARKYSGDGAYARQVTAMGKMYANADRVGVDASVIAEAIHAAVMAARPRPRYAAPLSAKVIIAAAKFLPDRLLDTGFRTLVNRLGR
jgi:short-subunit dehydrogenase